MDRTVLNITSPLTIIAVFATLIEASALASLPFLNDDSQDTYTWFLVGFPPFLTLLFFVTLNFNSKALYPSTEPTSAATPATLAATVPASADDAVVILLGDPLFCDLARESLVEPLRQLNCQHPWNSRIVTWSKEKAGETLLSALVNSKI